MHNLISGLLIALVSSGYAYGTTYDIDSSHAQASFKVKHLMVSNVQGKITGITGKLDLNDKDITKSKVEATLDANTINTDNTKRDEHLRSADFLDVKKFPTIKFVSKKVAKAGTNLKVTGDLTIHGVTKEVVLDVEGPTAAIKDPWGMNRKGMSATTKINRKDFGMGWNKAIETGGVVVGEELTITIDAELVEAKKDKA